MIFVAIDPGLSGAVAALDENGNIIALQETPTLLVKKGKKNRHVYVPSAMKCLLEPLKQIYKPSCITERKIVVTDGDYEPVLLTLENVHAMPGQGVTSMFSMGRGLGLWEGIAITLGFPLQYVEPVVWKRAMQIPTGSDKGASVVRAAQLFPTAGLRRKSEDGKADALLIAEYARRVKTESW